MKKIKIPDGWEEYQVSNQTMIECIEAINELIDKVEPEYKHNCDFCKKLGLDSNLCIYNPTKTVDELIEEYVTRIGQLIAPTTPDAMRVELKDFATDLKKIEE